MSEWRMCEEAEVEAPRAACGCRNCYHARERALDPRLIALTRDPVSKPFVRAKSDVYSVSLPTITYWPNGKFTTEYDEWTSNQLAEIDRLWLEARNHFCTVNGLDLPEPTEADNG